MKLDDRGPIFKIRTISVSILGIVRSLIASHRAKCSHPDRKIFIPQSRRLPCAGHFSRRLAQLRSTVPNSPTAVPIFPATVPNFPTTFPRECPTIPTGEETVPNEPTAVPNFSASLPIFPRVFPNFPATFPNFSPADLISNGLFHSHLGTISAKSRKKRTEEPSPVLSDTLSHRMGEGRGEGVLTFNSQLPTPNS